MAGENRRPGFDLRQELLSQGKHFSFFQAMRLLRLVMVREGTGEGDPLADRVRVRANLALAHPSTEIDSIEELPESQAPYRITANFLGLIGESSPLPVFYTEDIVNMNSEQQVQARGFLDIINFPFYLLFHRVWSRYRVALKVVEEEDSKYVKMLYCLLGLGLDGIEDELPDSFELVRYLGLMTRSAKSAAGLKTLLSDALREKRIEIVPCVESRVPVPEEQRCLVGKRANVIGDECYLGSEVRDRTSKFRVKVGPVEAEKFMEYMPGKPAFEKLVKLTRLYLREPLDFEVEVALSEGEAKSAVLGEDKWSRLGMDAWMLAEEHNRRLEAVYDIRPAL